MSIALVYATYLAVSIGLIAVVASGLSRSGRVVLAQMLGGDEGLASAVSRMLVIGFCLLSLGYVALTVRTSGQIRGPGQAIGVTSVKIGEELLAFGALYLLDIAMFARFRRRHETRRPGQPAGGYQPTGGPGAGQDLAAGPEPVRTRAASPGPQPREAIH